MRLRTGGSSAEIKRERCAIEGDGVEWSISGDDKNRPLRLPVRYRYRSPVFFEFHVGGKRHTDIFSALWLQGVVDGEEKDFDLPIWRCSNGMRLSQNYITEDNFNNIPDMKIETVGRLRFRGRFKAGTDRDHLRFVSDNDSRETIESWEACFAEGVRQEEVSKELPPVIQKLHDDSLTQGRDILASASEEDKTKWLAKDGTDWTGAFGQDPAAVAAGLHDDDDTDHEDPYESDEDESLDSPDSPTAVKHQGTDLGISDATTDPTSPERNGEGPRESTDTWATKTSTNGSVDTTATSATKSSKNPIKQYKDYKNKSRDLHRQHRGLMQWRPMRNVQFAKDEAKFMVRRVTKLGALDGRKPDVETEV